MLEFMTKLVESIDYRLGKRLIILLIVGIFFFSAIDNSFLYFNRVESRIKILQEFSKIERAEVTYDDSQKDDMTDLEIEVRKAMQKEYNGILNELKTYNNSIVLSEFSLFNQRVNKSVKILKTISGAIVFAILLGIEFLFNRAHLNVAKVANLIILSMLSAAIAYLMPTFRVHEINYYGYPALIVLYLALDYLDKNAVNEA